MAGRGGSDPKCILMTATNKATKKPWEEAVELVEAGQAKFISHTEFRAYDLGVKVPADIKKQGDRAVKDYIQSQTKPAEGRKARKSKEEDTGTGSGAETDG